MILFYVSRTRYISCSSADLSPGTYLTGIKFSTLLNLKFCRFTNEKPLTTSFNCSHCYIYIFENPAQTCLYFYVQNCVLKPNNLEPHEMSVTQEPVGVGEIFFLQLCFQHKNIQEVNLQLNQTNFISLSTLTLNLTFMQSVALIICSA